MIKIKMGKKRIKLFNLLILIFITILIIYLLLKLFFLLPIFTTKYHYQKDYESYKVSNNLIIKRNILSCSITEEKEYEIKSSEIKDFLFNDLKLDNFEFRKNRFIKKEKHFGFCKKYIKEYKKIYNEKYTDFKLNGNLKEEIKVLSTYEDYYVDAKVDNKKTNNITVLSNLNTKKVGTYIISYTLNTKNKERLYRIINVIDDEKPVINLMGNDKIILEYNEKYIEPGFTALDNLDGNITNKVKVKNNVNIKKEGSYEVVYEVKDSVGNKETIKRNVIVNAKKEEETKPVIKEIDGLTYVDGILIVNKKFGLPKEYAPGVNKEAYKALTNLQADAKALNLDLPLVSGYRSYQKQKSLYDNYVKKDGKELADTYSAKPGFSEHQTGLAFDVGSTDDSFADTNEAKWLEQNAHLYGFIIRYPKDKINITGYIYEPWHIRYLGVEVATKVKESGLSLEEYLKID